jgi:hypothetical protein
MILTFLITFYGFNQKIKDLKSTIANQSVLNNKFFKKMLFKLLKLKGVH